MSEAQLQTQIFDNQIRIDSVTWLPGAIHGFTDDDFFEEVILEAIDGEAYMHESMSVFQSAPEWARNDEEVFCEWLGNEGPNGFIVCVHTPRPYKFFKDSYHTNGFGYTMATYIYVEKVEDAVPLAIAWAEGKIADMRIQAKEDGEIGV